MSRIKSTVYIRYILLFVFILLLVTSCSMTNEVAEPTAIVVLDPSLKDTSWLTGVPCKLPCWYGINVGTSTKEEVLSLIQPSSFIDFSGMEEGESQYWDPRTEIGETSLHMSFPCKHPTGRTCAHMFFVDNILMQIIITPNYQITFGEVVRQIGEPDYLTARPIHPEIINCQVILIWGDLQMSIDHFYYLEQNSIDMCKYISDNDYRPPKDILVESVRINIQEYYDFVPSPREDFIWRGFMDD